MTISIKSPTSTTGSIQKNGSDVITIDASDNVTVANDLTVSGTISGTGTSQWSTSGSNISYTTGNVGIGTSSPTTTLDVETIVRSKANAATNDATVGKVSFYNTNAAASANPERASIEAGRENSAWGAYLKFATSTGTSAATEAMRIDSSGSVFVGPTATQNGATGVVYSKTTAKAWVTFTGSTGAILSSFNVSSVTRVSAGSYTVNFTSAMPNANYSSFYMAQPTVTNAGADTFTINPTTSNVNLRHYEAGVIRDSSYSCFVVFGSA
jgi:hypothetical protein